MTPGYGPQDGQQGQWGPGGQNPPPQPQWGQPEQPPAQPQWGQASPPPAPGGYPGASGSGGIHAAASEEQAKRARARKLGLAMLILSVLILGARLVTPIYMFVISGDGGTVDTDDITVTQGLSGLATLLSWIANAVFTLPLLVIAIIAAIQFSGRARIGSIMVIAGLILSVPAYWILGIVISAIVFAIAGTDAQGTMYVVSGVAEILRLLLFSAVFAAGSFMVLAWGRQSQSVSP